jgi:hypothetical protein
MEALTTLESRAVVRDACEIRGAAIEFGEGGRVESHSVPGDLDLRYDCFPGQELCFFKTRAMNNSCAMKEAEGQMSPQVEEGYLSRCMPVP